MELIAQLFEHPAIVTFIYVVFLFGLPALAAYFFGCFNGAVIVSKYILHDDIRGHGSGNAGLTNFYRVFGGKLTLVVLLTDVLKAVVAVLLCGFLAKAMFGDPASYYSNPPDPNLVETIGRYYGGFFCLLGHSFPVMFGFKGGKGVLSGGTVALMVDWRVALVVWGGFLILAVATRYVSLGSVFAGAAFPFATWFVYQNAMPTILSAGCAALLLWGHRGNIKRLLKGEESKFSFHRKKETD